jgi:hypothetical protein
MEGAGVGYIHTHLLHSDSSPDPLLIPQGGYPLGTAQKATCGHSREKKQWFIMVAGWNNILEIKIT